MLVIAVHSTEEGKIIDFCKKLISDFSKNFSDFIFYRNIPFFLPVSSDFLADSDFLQKDISSDFSATDFSNDELKKLAGKIKALQIEAPVFSKDFTSILLPLKIEAFNENHNSFCTYFSFFPLIKTILKNNAFTEEQKLELQNLLDKKNAASELFPMQLKIFRLANQEQIDKITTGLTSFVWKKIK
ncbi:MAG: hypothetical protein MJ188_04060 [Treponema sp.]|nr:hypothetical protein [Treponema sp.]